MKYAFSIREAVAFGWEKVKTHSALVFGVVLTLFGLQVASSVTQKVLQGSALGGATSIVIALLGIVLGAGMTLIFLKLAKGEPARYRDIVPSARLVWKYFAASLLSGIIILLPLMAGGLVSLALLVSTGSINFSEGTPVPGNGAYFALAALVMLVAVCFALYFAIRYSLSRFAVLDGAGIIESLRTSAGLTEGVKWRLALLMLAVIALNILGLVVFLVGLLVSIPVSLLAFAHVYLKLKAYRGH